MKKISKATFDRINLLSPDELVTHGIIQPARVSGFTCPICGSGSGNKGTGMNTVPNADVSIFHCFSCNANFNPLQLCARHYGLTIEQDFRQLVETICADFNIALELEEFAIVSGRRKKKSRSRQKPLEPRVVEEILKDLNATFDELERYMACVKTWRGFDFAFLKSHGVRLINNWSHPVDRVQYKPQVQSRRMIIPNGDASYLARAIDSSVREDFQKQHAGHKKLFNPDALNSSSMIFCVEGYIDAMSIELAGFQAVALGGAADFDLLVAAVERMDYKPKIIIMLDSDDAGRKNAACLYNDLISVKCPCCIRELSKAENEINGLGAVVNIGGVDANHILNTRGVEVLRVILQDIYDNALSEIACVDVEFNKHADCGLSDDDWAFIFSGDSSDLDFARRLETFCGDDIRWLSDDEYWLTYSNGVWQHMSEKSSALAPFANKLADAMRQNAKGKDEIQLADKLKSSKKVSSVVAMLKGISSILIKSTDLDQHPNLLNCLNGVIDLETGELYPADPRLYLTQQVSVAYDPNADSTFVENFFTQIQPDEETRMGFIRWLGYCLTGSVREEKFLIWLGSGANGKGVTSRAISALLNSYAASLPRNALITRSFDNGDGHTAALNALVGSRFAISEELPQNITLDASLLKNLTGGDKQTFRRLREEFKAVAPTGKINMSSNFVPKLQSVDDDGMERRMLVMPFMQSFRGDKADPRLKEKILSDDNQRGLLKLLVAQAQAWFKDGLIISDAMTKATRASLDANDFLSDFLEEFCDIGGTNEISRRVMVDKVREKCIQAHRFSDRDLCKMIERRGVRYLRSKHGFIFKGIRFLTDDDFRGEPVDDDDLPFDD